MNSEDKSIIENTISYKESMIDSPLIFSNDENAEIIKEIEENKNFEIRASIISNRNSKNLINLTFLSFIKEISSIILPGTLFTLGVITIEIINLAFIGRKYNDDDMIKGIGFSLLYMNCTMFAVIQGLIESLDTLCSNAYAMKKFKQMGIYVHKARIVGIGASLIIVVIHYFTIEKLMRIFNLNERAISFSLDFAYGCMVYIFLEVQTDCLFRYLNVIDKSWVTAVIILIALPLHVLCNYIFITILDLNVTGSALCFVINRLIICIMATVYVHLSNPCPESYFCINKSCFKNLWSYIRFSSGVAFIMCAWYWAFEIIGIISTILGEDDYTVYVIINQYSWFLYSLSQGFSNGCSIITAYYITNDHHKVRKIALYSICFGLLVNFFILSIFYIFKQQLIELFINKIEIVEKGLPVMLLLCLNEIFDNLQAIMCSILRGLGLNFIAGLFTFIQFFLIMITLSWVFGYILAWGVYGVFFGILIGNLSATILYILYFYSIDLEKIKNDTLERLKRDDQISISS